MKLYIPLALLIVLLFVLSGTSALGAIAQINVTINVANNSVFNTTTPQLLVTCMDSTIPTNTTTFNVTVLNSSSVTDGPANLGIMNVNTTSQVQANVSTAINLSALPSPSFQHVQVRCFNATGLSGSGVSAVNDSSFGIYINARPSISSVAQTSGIIPKNSPITFTVAWTDRNSTDLNGTLGGTDWNALYVCSSNNFKTTDGTFGGCLSSDTTFCSASANNGSSSTCTYTTLATDTPGTNTGYVWLVDQNNFTTSTGTTVTWQLAGTFDEQQQAADDALANQQRVEVARAQAAQAQATVQQASGNGSGGLPGWALVVIIVVFLVALYFIFIHKT